jgi:hypothetical protein
MTVIFHNFLAVILLYFSDIRPLKKLVPQSLIPLLTVCVLLLLMSTAAVLRLASLQ